MANIASELNSQGRLALEALQEYGEKKPGKKLFPEMDMNVSLMAKYKKMPMSIEGPGRKFIQLPCPDRDGSNTSICLILPDMDKSAKAARDPDVDKQAREWAEQLRESLGLVQGTHYAKIFTMKQMEREYSRVQDRGKLANAYDVFMVDRKLMKKVFHFMGRHFRRSAKRPLPINADRNFTKDLERACAITQLVLAPMSDSIVIRFGNLRQPLDDLQANLRAALDVFLPSCPGEPVNIRSCYLNALGTSLPIYVDFGSANEVKLEERKQREYAVELGECSTLPDGLAVKVRADGKIRVVEAKTGQEVLYPTEQDEWEKTDDLKPLSKALVEKALQKIAQKKRGKKAMIVKQPAEKMRKMKAKKEEEPKEEVEVVDGKNAAVVEEGPKRMKRKRKSEGVEEEEVKEENEGEKEKGRGIKKPISVKRKKLAKV